MTDPWQALLQAGALKIGLFPATSRYHCIDTATLEISEGRTIVFLQRRFVPAPEGFALLQEHTVVQGDRLDNIAAKHLGDPEQFWRICDANGILSPEELTETIGRVIRITLPEGMPGSTNA